MLNADILLHRLNLCTADPHTTPSPLNKTDVLLASKSAWDCAERSHSNMRA